MEYSRSCTNDINELGIDVELLQRYKEPLFFKDKLYLIIYPSLSVFVLVTLWQLHGSLRARYALATARYSSN